MDPEILIFEKFTSSESVLDNLYSDERYDGKFVVKTKSGEFHSVHLEWEQGRHNNYRFSLSYPHDFYAKVIWPDDVTHIESR